MRLTQKSTSMLKWLHPVWRKSNILESTMVWFENWSWLERFRIERMKQCWISGSNFLTNLCFVGERRGGLAPHVWEAPRARMAEMEATGNLPKETTRSQWAWAQPAFILWEVERAFKHKVEGWVTIFSDVKQLPHGFSSIGMKLHYSLSWQDQASGCLKFKYPLQFMRSGLCLPANLNVP